MTNTQTFETSKTVKYSVAALIKMTNNLEINFNHPAQRKTDQWNGRMKSNLISDILQGNPVPPIVLAEQIRNKTSVIWNLDGKQRCTVVYNYVSNGFKIGKSVRRNIIEYQEIVRDENGMPVVDENGIPDVEWKEFDIINKTFSQLPEVLQDRILNYCFDATLYLNCSEDDIFYHIARYNDGKAMNQAQKGITNLSEYARVVKDISENDFFDEHGKFTEKDVNNGVVDRTIVETVMATEFIDNWKGSSSEKTCEFLNDNATEDMFNNVEDTLNRLDDVVTEESDELFTSKDSFVWFTVFNRNKNRISDEIFGEFLVEVVHNLHELKVNGISLDDIGNGRNTKDKITVVNKIEHIESLLDIFLNGDNAA